MTPADVLLDLRVLRAELSVLRKNLDQEQAPALKLAWQRLGEAVRALGLAIDGIERAEESDHAA